MTAAMKQWTKINARNKKDKNLREIHRKGSEYVISKK